MVRIRSALLLSTAAVVLPMAACFGGGAGARGELPGERRAALARLVIDNQTTHPVAIAFRYATESGGPGGEVGVGTVAAGARTEVAPIPADEPIILIARGPGLERRLEPVTLEIDEVRTWVIHPDRPGTP